MELVSHNLDYLRTDNPEPSFLLSCCHFFFFCLHCSETHVSVCAVNWKGSKESYIQHTSGLVVNWGSEKLNRISEGISNELLMVRK